MAVLPKCTMPYLPALYPSKLAHGTGLVWRCAVANVAIHCVQIKKTAYAQSSQIRQIRKKMVEIMTREASSCDLKELVGKFIPEAIGEPTFLPETLLPAGSLADTPRADAHVPRTHSLSA